MSVRGSWCLAGGLVLLLCWGTARAENVWRSFGNDAVAGTLLEVQRQDDRLIIRLEVENLTEADQLFVHHAPDETDPRIYTFLPPRNRQAPATAFRTLAPLATASWQVAFFLPKGTRPGLLVLGEARKPYRQAAILLGDGTQAMGGGYLARASLQGLEPPTAIPSGVTTMNESKRSHPIAVDSPGEVAALTEPRKGPSRTPADAQIRRPEPRLPTPMPVEPTLTVAASMPPVVKAARPTLPSPSVRPASLRTTPLPSIPAAVAMVSKPTPTPRPTVVPVADVRSGSPDPRKASPSPSASPVPRRSAQVAARPASPEPASRIPRATRRETPPPAFIGRISLSARPSPVPRPAGSAATAAKDQPQPKRPPAVSSQVAMLPALPPGDSYVAALRPGTRALEGLLVLRLGLAPSSRTGGFGWRRIKAEEPAMRLEDLASVVDQPAIVARSGRSWLLARELGARWVVLQTDGSLVVAARYASEEDVTAWTSPGGPYAQVLERRSQGVR
ncbi:MAG: hypothetical protein VKO21_09465 [Candidatus Sericytochromatia bacterium]|nr:hypothetical protein [Candidatus Sericytochromatia bacterium]